MRGRPGVGGVAIAIYGAAALAFLTLAAMPGSPLRVPQPAGFPDGGPFARLAQSLGLDGSAVPGRVALVIGSAVALVIGHLLILKAAGRGSLGARPIFVLAVVVHVSVLVLPMVYSRDVYSYALYGRIGAEHGADPYQLPPSAFPDDPLFPFVGDMWRQTPPVYGPAFTVLGIGLATAATSPAQEVLGFRILAVAASLATAACIAATCSRLAPSRTAWAVAAYALAPVVPFLIVASGHNDVLLALAAAAGFLLVSRARHPATLAVLTCGALVKLTGGVTMVLEATSWICTAPTRGRWRRVVAATAIVGGLTLLFASPFLSAENPTLSQNRLASHEGWLAPFRVIRLAVVRIVGPDLATPLTRAVFMIALLGAIAMIGVRLGRRSARDGQEPLEQGAAWCLALLLTLLLIQAHLPWYVAWLLPVVWPAPGWVRAASLSVATVAFLSLPVADLELFPGAFRSTARIANELLAPLVLVLLGYVLVRTVRLLRDPSARFADASLGSAHLET